MATEVRAGSVVLEYPDRDAALVDDTRESEPAEAGKPAAGAEAATILVVDDEPLARQMFTDLLQAHGFRVIAAENGDAALPQLADADLVLLDAMLPGRDGWEICREIKERHDPLLPVIMVTARTAPEDVVRTFSAGADDYVAKPFHVTELIARIGSRLRVHRAEMGLQQANRQLSELARQNYQLYEQAKRDAEERSHLFRELDHRVRNNLSIIMGLVGMERNRRPSRPTPDALASLEHRLRAFLLVHEALRRQNYRGVPIREIAERMAQRLRNTLGLDERVGVQVSGEDLTLNERQGFSLALALNELLSNAFRHGLGESGAGQLTIDIAERDGSIRIQVCDDGPGVAASAEAAPVLGSGRSIVDALVRGELRGQVSYDLDGDGTCVTVSFPRG